MRGLGVGARLGGGLLGSGFSPASLSAQQEQALVTLQQRFHTAALVKADFVFDSAHTQTAVIANLRDQGFHLLLLGDGKTLAFNDLQLGCGILALDGVRAIEGSPVVGDRG